MDCLKRELGDIQDSGSCSWTLSVVKDKGAVLGFRLLPRWWCLPSPSLLPSPASGGEDSSLRAEHTFFLNLPVSL